MNHQVSRHLRPVLCASLACLAGTAIGQPSGAPEAATPPAATAPPATPAAPASAALKRATADALIRLAIFDLRARQQPAAEDYGLASMLLRAAADLVPDDLELAHRLVETGWGAGDEIQVLEATRRIVRLDPRDTVAQLRLISSRLGAFQTADERMARYDDFLGKKGESLDPAVRSRLALDAALLSRERSDEKGFIDRLKQAVRLDPTNKDAALMAYNFYCERVNNPTGRLELLSNLLYSDPLDPNLHMMMSDELATQGAFAQSRRFHFIGRGILAASGIEATQQMYTQQLLLGWLNDGPRMTAEALSKFLEENRTAVARRRRELSDDRSQSTADILSTTEKPENVRLNSANESLRACAAWVLDDQTLLSNSMADLDATTRADVLELETPNVRPQGMTDEQAKDAVRTRLQDLCLWKLLTDYRTESVRADVEKALEGLSDTDVRKKSVQAWMAIREGDAAGALLICDRGGENDQWTAMARAFALEMQGKKQEAAAVFDSIAQNDPLTLLGAVGFERAAMARGSKRKPGDEPTALAAAASAYVSKVPAWIDTMATNARAFESITLERGANRIPPLERATIRVRIKNTTSIPIAVGSDKPINTRFLFVPDMQIGAPNRPKASEPEVVDLGRRLRLLPGESFDAEVWPEGGLVGWTAQNASAAPTRVRWRVLQGFVTSTGPKIRGVGCLEINTDFQGRDALQESYLPAEALVERLERSDDSTLPALLIACRVALTQVADDPNQLTNSEKPTVAAALAKQYPSWSTTSRLLAVATLPPSGEIPELSVFDDVLRAETDKTVLLAAMISRATTPDDPLIVAAQASGDESLAKAASMQVDRLGKEGGIYAKTGVTPLLKIAPASGLTP